MDSEHATDPDQALTESQQITKLRILKDTMKANISNLCNDMLSRLKNFMIDVGIDDDEHATDLDRALADAELTITRLCRQRAELIANIRTLHDDLLADTVNTVGNLTVEVR